MELPERYKGSQIPVSPDGSAEAQMIAVLVDPTVIVTKLADCYRDMAGRFLQMLSGILGLTEGG